MPDVDKCPHCDQGITEQDLANYPRKLREKELRKEFANSDIMREHNKILGGGVFIGLLGAFFPVLVLLLATPNEWHISSFYVWVLFTVEIAFSVFTIVWLMSYFRRIDRVRDDYINSRLD